MFLLVFFIPHLFCFQVSAQKLHVVDLPDRRISFIPASHFNESKFFRLPRFVAHDHLHAEDLTKMTEQFSQMVFAGGLAQVADKDVDRHRSERTGAFAFFGI